MSLSLGELIRQAAEAEQPRDEQLLEEANQAALDENQTLEHEKLVAEVEEIKAELSRKKDVHRLRIYTLAALFILIVAWLITICVFLFFSGRQYEGIEYTYLQLSDPVLIALIGSTTVNVVGLFYLAAQWLYGDRKKS